MHGEDRIAGGRCGRDKRLHVDLARRAAVGREPIGLEVFDGCRRDKAAAPVSWTEADQPP